MSFAHFLWSSTGSADKPMIFALRLSNSAFIFAMVPSSVVHTGVKSLGCEKRIAHLSPIHNDMAVSFKGEMLTPPRPCLPPGLCRPPRRGRVLGVRRVLRVAEAKLQAELQLVGILPPRPPVHSNGLHEADARNGAGAGLLDVRDVARVAGVHEADREALACPQAQIVADEPQRALEAASLPRVAHEDGVDRAGTRVELRPDPRGAGHAAKGDPGAGRDLAAVQRADARVAALRRRLD